MPRDGSGVYATPSGTNATSLTSIASAAYNAFLADLVSDLNAPRPISAGGTGSNTQAGAQTALGLAIGVNVQAFNARLASMAGLAPVTGQIAYFTGTTAMALADTAAYGRSLWSVANEAAFKALVNLEAGVDYQAFDSNLSALSGASWIQGDLPYRGSSTFSRLPKGTAGNSLRMNAGAVAPEWVQDYPVKAWGNFSGVSGITIRASGNVGSIVRNSVGSYSVFFTVALGDANYAVAPAVSSTPSSAHSVKLSTAPGASGFTLHVTNLAGTFVDSDAITFTVVR